ncbi:MAG: RNA-binding S4 domain-containing protein [Clostridiales bacterium]|nr:RNA-binding S4 domain-containing protein [Clostridiales bacterium]
MRIDKFLKVSRLIKRRTVAKEACDQGRVFINDKQAKAGSEIEIGDIVTIKFGNGEIKAKVLTLAATSKKETAAEMFELLN